MRVKDVLETFIPTKDVKKVMLIDEADILRLPCRPEYFGEDLLGNEVKSFYVEEVEFRGKAELVLIMSLD